MDLTKVSKNIQDRMKRCDLYWKRLESVNKKKKIIYKLEWMWLKQDMIYTQTKYKIYEQ